MKKIFLTTIIIFILIVMGKTKSQAREIQLHGGNFGNSYAVEFTPVTGNMTMKFSADSKALQIAGMIFGVVSYICYGAAFIILLIKGVQFMSAAPEGKAEIKKQLIAIAIGTFILFTIRRLLIIISGLNLF